MMLSILAGVTTLTFMGGVILILLGGIESIVFLIKRMLGAQKVTAKVVDYKRAEKECYRMYLNIDHKKAPAIAWLNENVKFEDGKPKIKIGETLEVYWLPGMKTAMRADSPKWYLIMLVGGVASLALTFVIGYLGVKFI